MPEDITLSISETKEDPEIVREYSMSVDKYGNPLSYKNFNALGVLIGRLLLLEPGTITHSPLMGVGLISTFRYMKSDRKSEFEDVVKSQITDYIDPTLLVDVHTEFVPNRNIMQIFITINNVDYAYNFDRDNITLEMIKGSST